MKLLSSLLLLVGMGSTFVHAYEDCNGCAIVSVEDGVEWGVENDDWCVIPAKCKSVDSDQCFSYPEYPCCNGCDVYEETEEGKWGIENDSWCGIKNSCFETGGEEKPKYEINDGWYNIKNPGSGKYLQVRNGANASNVYIGSKAQKWKVTNMEDGYFTLLSMFGDFMLDVANGEDKNGANVQIYASHRGDAQQFKALPTSKDKVYTIGAKVSDAKKVLDIEKNGTSDGSNVLIWENGEKSNQSWIFEATTEPTEEEINPPKSSFNYDPAIKFREAPNGYLNPCQKAGRIVKESYNSINGRNNLLVYLPYGYTDSQKYNVFYLMHGGGENENTIFSNDVKLQHILDHMIMNGELEPLIVVTPTFNKCEARTFYKEFRQSVIPFVEGKYPTYAKSTSAEDIKASRYHRAFGGFSMGSASTWAVFINCLDICAYYMPLSGDNWEADGAYNKAKTVADAVKKFGLNRDEFYIFCATGSDDIAYNNMNPQINEMKKMDTFIYTSDFSQGNFYYLVAQGKTHWWGYVRHYIYDALPSFFHEHQN